MTQSKTLLANTRNYTSNLITDEELAVRFNKSAYYAMKLMKKKYYSVFEVMTEDDLVQEIWIKVLQTDLSYDESRNPNFDAFVRMVVTCKCIDWSRKLQSKGRNNTASLDEIMEVKDGSNLNKYDLLTRDITDYANDTELLMIMRELDTSFENTYLGDISLTDVLKLREAGYINKEISELSKKYKSSRISSVLKVIKPLYEKRIKCKGHSLEDILFDSELDYFSTHEMSSFLKTLSYVRDAKYNIKLSDVVKYVLNDKSYKYIAEKLNVSDTYIQSFFESQLGKVF